jgi:acyl dehydratase
MTVPLRHLLQQGPVVRSLLSAGVRAARARPSGGPAPTAPGPVLEATVPPRPDALVRDYVRHLGGDPSAYRTTLPAHLFPQWGFPLLARTLHGIPWDLRKVLNGGCVIDVVAPLPAHEPLQLRAWLDHVDDDGRRVVLRQRLTTTTPSGGHVECTMFAIVPLARDKGAKAEKRERPSVPADAHPLASVRFTPGHARDFAVLTGDVNPVHWLVPAAKASGFRSTILHGFATLGRGIEAIVKNRLAGDVSRFRGVDVKFVRPVVLPARVTYFVTPAADGAMGWFAGSAPGGPAYLTGTFRTR